MKMFFISNLLRPIPANASYPPSPQRPVFPLIYHFNLGKSRSGVQIKSPNLKGSGVIDFGLGNGYPTSMPRRRRVSTGGLAYHVLNRAVGRGRLFDADRDYAAMERVLQQTQERFGMRLVSYCLMPNHWHLVLWPREDGELSEFMRLLTVTHTQRWHAHHDTAGTGPVYQGRFKSFPIQQDAHFLTVCRYVERNALRARLVQSAQRWPWCSLAKRDPEPVPWLLEPQEWPVEPPRDWSALVNRPQTPAEEKRLRESVIRGRPFGTPRWTITTAKRLRLKSTLRPRGRPRVRPLPK
jgi:putative transposase